MRLAERLREAFKKGYEGTAEELARVVGEDKRKVAQILSYLKTQGEILRDGNCYRLNPEYMPKLKRADRVWRAWRMCPTWSVDEIARIAEVPKLYVRNLRDYFLRTGYVVKVSRGRYRLLDRDLRERPKINTEKYFERSNGNAGNKGQ